MEEPDLENLPDWVKSLGLPPEAVAAIDRYWKPVWEELELLPAHTRAAPATAPPAGAEQLEFEAVEELEPGAKWQARFNTMWPAYRAWYLKDGGADRPDLETCRRALTRHMPELVPTYERLVGLAGGDEMAARLLSLYRPPGFVVGCSQGAWTRDEPVLVRNYDYPVARLEGLVYLTEWTGRRVLGMSDCLWGLLDGVNDAGLAVSLTFGGRRDVGDGFGIPIVVRYLLEVCTDVAEAREALASIPVHAAQNLTLLDRSGALPDRLRRPRPRARVPRHRGHDQPPGQGRLARVRARDPHRRARAVRARPARRPGDQPRALRRARSSSRRCTTPSTARASGRSTPPPTTRPRAGPSTAGRASRGSSPSTASRRRGTRETFTPS